MNYQDKVVYQIYPKSFNDSNGDGFGDIKGIIARLDYLKDLGIDYIWSTPFFVSPQNDNGYDVEDYYKIDPRFGTMEDLEELISEANKRDIKLMFDMVFNHTSTNHIWFKKALKKDPKYHDYYIFKKSDEVPTNWISKFGGTTWEYVKELGEYYLHLFDKTQADLNWDNAEVRQELADIVNFWLEKGVGGFRFDVVNLISKPETYIDDDVFDGRRFYTDGHKVHEYIKELCKKTFNDKDVITVGEMSSTTIDNCVRYSNSDENELSMIFSFHHLKVDYNNGQKWQLKPFDFMELKNLYRDWQEGMQEKNGWNALFLNNHDQPRALSRFANDNEYRMESAKMLATTTFMMRGTPYIYQGEEIGMTNAYITDLSDYRDVESINYAEIMKNKGLSHPEIVKLLQERSRDNSRTPMQWNNSFNAGFSSGEPWLKVNPNYKYINVENNIKSDDSIFHYYQQLIRLRKEYEVISKGLFKMLSMDDDAILIYKRYLEDKEIIVVANFYEKDKKFNLSEYKNYEILLNNYSRTKIPKVLKPFETIVLSNY